MQRALRGEASFGAYKPAERACSWSRFLSAKNLLYVKITKKTEIDGTGGRFCASYRQIVRNRA